MCSSDLTNKVCFGVSDLGRARQAHRHGGGARRSWSASGAQGKMDEAAPWRSHAEANSGRGDFWLRWQPLHTPMQFLRGCMFNLLRWRPFYLDAPAIQAHLRSSGLVPGVGMGRWCCRSSSACGEQDDGLDCVSTSLIEVLYVKVQGFALCFLVVLGPVYNVYWLPFNK